MFVGIYVLTTTYVLSVYTGRSKSPFPDQWRYIRTTYCPRAAPDFERRTIRWKSFAIRKRLLSALQQVYRA